MISAKICAWASTCQGAPKQSPKKFWASRKTPRYRSKPSHTLWFATKSSPGHQRVEVHQNRPPKPTKWTKNPCTFKTKKQTMICDSFLLGISVSRYTEVVLKNVLRRLKKLPDIRKFALQTMMCDKIFYWASVCRSTNSPQKRTQCVENLQIYSKPSHKLWFATKSSPRHQLADAHWNSPQKRTQRVEKPPGTVKTNIRLWFRTKSSPGYQRDEVDRNSPQKRTRRVQTPPGRVKTETQTMISVKIFSCATACRGTPK